jgi:hypothetical protein
MGDMVTRPDPTSAAAAVEVLRGELGMINDSMDRIDQKAALVPAALGTIAALFFAPDLNYAASRAIAIGIALVLAGLSILFAVATLRSRLLNVGPNAKTTADHVHLEPGDFNRAVAGSLADSVAMMSELSQRKGDRLNVSLILAAAAIFAMGLSRLA